MFPLLKSALFTVGNRILPSSSIISSSFHFLSKPNLTSPVNSALLTATVQNIVPNCGFKVMGRVRKRCQDCYMVRREERLFVLCKKHPRHKQMSMVKDPKNTWILTHATQSKVRPW